MIDSAKYRSILHSAKALFWKHGIRRVSVEEICREAGVSKMTFYRFFPNKVELAKTMLEGLFNESMTAYRELMEQDIPFEEKVRRQLLLKFQGVKEISAELLRDIYSNEEWGLRSYMEQRTEEALQVIIKDYTHAQQMGWIRQDLKLEFILYILHQMQSWVTDTQLQNSYRDAHDLIMDIAHFFFYGILPLEPQGNE